MIDTSILISAGRGKFDFEGLIASHPQEAMAVSVITASELLHGVHRTGEPAHAAREAFVEKIISRIPVVPIDMTIARVHARLAAGLSAVGQPIGAHDLLIAATAVSMGYRVVTRDQRSFSRVPGLDVLVL
ncbi:MAG TPA: PIN domain-containing protein [Tepidisphaeraceae bacterium]|nr:PIN domain-containing protein [Tepidisphaeraceae bacterium]